MNVLNITLVMIGLGTSGLLTLAFFALVARTVGPASFGLFVTVHTLLIYVLDVMELAMNASLVRAAGEQNADISGILRGNLRLRLLGGMIMLGIGLLASYPVALLLGTPKLSVPMLLALAGGIGFLGQSLVLSYFQVVKKFFLYAVFAILPSLLRLGLLVTLAGIMAISLEATVLILVIPSWVVTGVGWFYLPRNFSRSKAPLSSHFSAASISGLGLFYLLAATQSRLDIPMLLKLAGSIQVGLYGAAQRLWFPVSNVTGAISTVFAPQYSQAKTKGQVRLVTKKLLPFVAVLSVVVLLTVLATPTLMGIFGMEFRHALVAAQVYGVALIPTVLLLPTTTFLMYTVRDSKYLALISFAMLITMLAVGVFLIPTYGAVGASLTVLTSSIFGFIALTYRALSVYKELPT